MTGAPAVIHVVDDDASFRTAVARLFEGLGYKVALYESAAGLLERRPSDERGCILLDVHMEGLSGIQLQQVLGRLGSTLPIVFLTGHGDIPTSVRAIKAGAEDFLAKPAPKEILTDAIDRALARYDESRGQRDRLGALRARLADLTPREREVFALVIRGRLNKQIAFELGTSERTIKAHRRAVMQKAQVQSVVELVSLAEQLHLVPQCPRSSPA
jgi:FixJ family two-component response regulator